MRWSNLVALTAEADDDVGVGFTEERVFGGAAGLERGKFFEALFFFEACGLGAEAVGFAVIERTHVGLGDAGDGARRALLAATGAGAIAGDEGLVVATDHEVIAEGGFAGAGGIGVVVEAEEFYGECRVGRRKPARW